jgi:ABC-type phosphate/phosphonate transport system permease subunit
MTLLRATLACALLALAAPVIVLLLAAAASNLSFWMRQVFLRLVSALRIFQKKWQDGQYPLPA